MYNFFIDFGNSCSVCQIDIMHKYMKRRANTELKLENVSSGVKLEKRSIFMPGEPRQQFIGNVCN